MQDKFFKATDTIKELLVWLALNFIVAALLFSFFEARSFIDSLWWAITTGMTIGYGDIYPVTNAGRIVATLLVFTNIFVLLPLYTSRLVIKAMLDKDKFTDEEQEEIKTLLRTIADQTKIDVDHVITSATSNMKLRNKPVNKKV